MTNANTPAEKGDTMAEARASTLAQIGDTPVVFGLEAQGHIPLIKKMLDAHAPWSDIASMINWDEATLRRHYDWYVANKEATSTQPAVPVPSDGGGGKLPEVSEAESREKWCEMARAIGMPDVERLIDERGVLYLIMEIHRLQRLSASPPSPSVPASKNPLTVIAEDGGHEWVDPTENGSTIAGVFCRKCLLMRRADGKNKQCGGPAKLTLREMAAEEDGCCLSVGGLAQAACRSSVPASAEQQGGDIERACELAGLSAGEVTGIAVTIDTESDDEHLQDDIVSAIHKLAAHIVAGADEKARLQKSLDRSHAWSNERWEVIRRYVERYMPEALDDFCGMIANGAATSTSADHAEASPGVKALAAEVASLKAVVDKLPKTADGVPIVPGMPLFAPTGRMIDGASPMPGGAYYVGASRYATVYSTEAAALAASAPSSQADITPSNESEK